MLRTHTCGELTSKNIGEEVILSGRVNKNRNLGGLYFIDLRDRYGLTQVAIDPNSSQLKNTIPNLESFLQEIKSEYVLQIKGKVVSRPSDMINKNMPSGEIEIQPTHIEILSKSNVLPFPIVDDPNTSEENRFKHRFLDLRRRPVLKNLEFRTKMAKFTRDWFTDRDFLEIQTPIFTVSSPEGARDYLIPSRVNPGKFYALPQAPQQYKQLLMVGGIDKYFQIAPCFRDEDPRADRHSCEFYQIDCEMSFVEQEDIYQVVESFMKDMVSTLVPHKKITTNFIKMKYVDAIDKYGTDKPDLRFAMEFVDMTQEFKNSEFSVFHNVANMPRGSIKAINFQNKILSRKEIDELTKIAQEAKAKGLAYISFTEEGTQGSIAKFFKESEINSIKSKLNVKDGDTILFIADEYNIATKAMNKVRLAIRDKYNLVNNDDLSFLWIEDFPMFEKDEETGKLDFAHNPFSNIKGGLNALQTEDIMNLETTQYDLILNGFESLSGSIRNHDPEVLLKVFQLAGLGEKEIKEKFGAMYNAFQYGAPPHGGFALGFDRIMMILLDEENIRECYAFPKSGKAEDVMMGAPGFIDQATLDELGITIKTPKEK
ncbi:MAG: aspartate--tRNA ligase [Candidatus Absconditabacterales bacterium]|nr:aspartate--tRNA ligase [Candidatus Absconditabacterales bacterium]